MCLSLPNIFLLKTGIVQYGSFWQRSGRKKVLSACLVLKILKYGEEIKPAYLNSVFFISYVR